jgi:hypothetical protein
MSTQLAGPELDALVAKELGWIKPSERAPARCDVCGWPLVPEGESGCWPSNCSMRPHPEPRADRIATYSTSPARIPQMLAWFKERTMLVRITCYATGEKIHPPIVVECGSWQAEGATIEHTLANLIVEVARARGRP